MQLVRLAVGSPLLLTLFLTAANNAWSQGKPTVRVEAMVGEAVVVFENIKCPDVIYDVATGQVAVTDPETCETVVRINTVPDNVSDVVWAIAQADPDDAEAIEAIAESLGDLTVAEQAMVVTVLQNNQQHLGTTDDTVIDTVGQIAAVNPDAAATVVLTATVLNPEAAEEIVAAAVATAPQQAEAIQEAVEQAVDIKEELSAPPESTPSAEEAAVDDDDGEDTDEDAEAEEAPADEEPVEVISISEQEETETETEEPPGSGQPADSPGDQVPPGGGDIPDVPEPPSPE